MKSSPLVTSDVLAALTERFEQRRSKSHSEAATTLGPYHLAGAVLHIFDPITLRPFGSAPPDMSAIVTVFADTVPAVGWRHEGFRSLKPEIRRAAFHQLGDRGTMQRAVSVNSARIRTPLQKMFETWLSGAEIVPEQMRGSELEILRQLYEWDLERFGGLPPRERFEAARMKRTSVSVFEHLVDANFVGREKELQSLRDYVGVVSPSRWSKVRSFLARGPKPPYVLTGAGGMGKTALVGKFLLEHVDSTTSGWFPFAYLVFDSDTLDVREPFTLLLAAASQLEAQVGSQGGSSSEDGLKEAFDAFRSVVAQYRDQRGILRQRASVARSQGSRLSRLSAAEEELYSRFAQLLNAISEAAAVSQDAKQVPVLLVFDTFEEVLYRTREELLGLWGMLANLQREFPLLRVVIASRIEPRQSRSTFELETHKLGDLDEKDSINLLQRLGVNDSETAKTIARQVGRNPLGLRLAARVAEAEDVDRDGISDIETKKFFLFGLGPELIRGQLYRRILDHIHDDQVRALAHPGMVLRRVTPAIILEVLAPACELKDIDVDRASDLFERLRHEQALVSIEADGSLRYRDEVRRPLLELLSRDKPEQVRQIHTLAADYYSRESIETSSMNVAARAEEIYHMLMLGADRSMLDLAWTEGVERYLASAIDEIPVTQRTWLAERMSIELPPEAYKMADLASWERIFGRKALETLRYEGPAAVLSLLSERKDRTLDSPLFAIETRALLALDRPADALVLVDAALDNYPPVGNLGRLAELLWIRSQAARKLNNDALAASTLTRLLDLSKLLASPLSRAQALTELVDVQTALNSKAVSSTRDDLAQTLTALSDAEVDAERSIVRLALVRLGAGYASIINRLLPLVIQDWLYVASERHVDVRSVLPAVERILREANQAELTSFAERIATEHDDKDAAFKVMSEIVERGASWREEKPELHPYTMQAALLLMSVENASLGGATLAGVEAYREPWELLAAPEVAA